MPEWTGAAAATVSGSLLGYLLLVFLMRLRSAPRLGVLRVISAQRKAGLLALGRRPARAGRGGRPSRSDLLEELAWLTDVLAVSSEGGLNLYHCLEAATHQQAGYLGRHLARVQEEVKAGVPLMQALENMARAVGSPEVRDLVRSIRIGQSMGTPLADILRQQAKHVRRLRKQELEARVEALPLKLTLVAVVFLFPPIIIVVLLPNVLNFLAANW